MWRGKGAIGLISSDVKSITTIVYVPNDQWLSSLSKTTSSYFLLNPKFIINLISNKSRVLACMHVVRVLATQLALRRKFLRLVKGKEETTAAWFVSGRVNVAFHLVAIGVEIWTRT